MTAKSWLALLGDYMPLYELDHLYDEIASLKTRLEVATLRANQSDRLYEELLGAIDGGYEDKTHSMALQWIKNAKETIWMYEELNR